MISLQKKHPHCHNSHGAEFVAHGSVGCVKDGFKRPIIQWREPVPLTDLASRRTKGPVGRLTRLRARLC